MSLESWAKRLARAETGSGPWDDRGWTRLFMLRIEQIVNNDLSLDRASWETITSSAGFYGAHITWDVTVPLDDRLRFLDVLARFARKVAPHVRDATALGIFWWDAVEGRMGAYELPGFPHVGQLELREKLYTILAEQARLPNVWLQESAWEGLDKLWDPRTSDLVEELRGRFASDRVRRLAEGAARAAEQIIEEERWVAEAYAAIKKTGQHFRTRSGQNLWLRPNDDGTYHWIIEAADGTVLDNRRWMSQTSAEMASEKYGWPRRALKTQ